MANLNKKQKRMVLIKEKMRNQTKAIMSRRQVLVQPDTERWSRIDPTLLRMERVRIGNKWVFTFKKSDAYRSL